MTFSKKQPFRLAILILLSLFLVACQGQGSVTSEKQPNEETQSVNNIPEVNHKYSEEEVADFQNRRTTGDTARYENLLIPSTSPLTKPDKLPQSLYYDSGIDVAYPEDGVRGVYLTATNVANPEYLDYIIDYINSTDLNAVVIDYKDDGGQIIPQTNSDNPLVTENTVATVDYRAVLEKLAANNIYPIARVVAFKDNLLADMRSDLSFVDPNTNEVWSDANGSKFINPFKDEVQQYILDVAVEAAKIGFKDIQFDYVRFPEGFYEWSDDLIFDHERYASYLSDDPEKQGYERTAAINDFLRFAREKLAPYGVDVSADIFGYTVVAGDTYDVRGIGQNFAQMAEHIDVVSSMIYPSHWGFGFFGLDAPDLYPYQVVDNYMHEEKRVLATVENEVTSRPWLQDFTYAYGVAGYKEYTAPEVQEQINALFAHGIHEFLLWNAGGQYTHGVDYKPDIPQTEGLPEETTTDQNE